MSLLDYIGGSVPRTPYQQERDVEDAMEGANALWNVQHNTDGTLKALPSLEVTGDSTLAGLTTNGARYAAEAVDIDLIGTTNDLKGVDGLPIDCEIIRFSASADRILTGIVPMDVTKMQTIELINRSSFTITLAHNSGSSLSANRFSMPSSVAFGLRSGTIAVLRYDRSSGIWRLKGGGGLFVQHGTVSFTGADLVGTATLATAVDTSRAYIGNYGFTMANASTAGLEGVAVLTNSTTVTMTRGSLTDASSAAAAGTGYFSVVEG